MPTFFATYRATVAPAACDHLGHMNVQHSFAAVSDGMFAIMARLGLGPDEIRRRQLSFAVVLGEKSALFQHRLAHAASGALAMSTEFKCVLLDLATRQAAPIPDDIRAAAAPLIAGERACLYPPARTGYAAQ